MNSKLFVVAGFAAWYLTFILGFFILAPSTDDGYYVIASMGTALTGNPGFWIGDDFAYVFFLPTAFTFLYGMLLKAIIVSGIDFGPFGFRFFQFVFLFLLPVVAALTLRRSYPRDYPIRLLLLLVFLSLTYFVQSAATVRPEVLGVVLFVVFLGSVNKSKNLGGFSAFLLALSGAVHPIFTLLALSIFGTSLIRRFLNHGFTHRIQWARTFIGFGIPFGLLAIYYLFNLTEFKDQTLGRASFLSTDALTAPNVVLNNLSFWSDSEGILFGLFSGYPAFAFVAVMLLSTGLVIYRGISLWRSDRLWLSWPIVLVQWFVFLLLPAFLPYMAFSSFLSALLIVLLWQPPQNWSPDKHKIQIIAAGGFMLCLVFIAFQGGKFVLIDEDRLTPSGLHTAMSATLENPETVFYTDAARLIPPLLDHYSEDNVVRLNFIYLSPDCLEPGYLDLANQHAQQVLTTTDPENTYWGLDWELVKRSGSNTPDGNISFVTKGSHSTITLTPTDTVYADNKNLITRASAVTSSVDPAACD